MESHHARVRTHRVEHGPDGHPGGVGGTPNVYGTPGVRRAPRVGPGDAARIRRRRRRTPGTAKFFTGAVVSLADGRQGVVKRRENGAVVVVMDVTEDAAQRRVEAGGLSSAAWSRCRRLRRRWQAAEEEGSRARRRGRRARETAQLIGVDGTDGVLKMDETQEMSIFHIETLARMWVAWRRRRSARAGPGRVADARRRETCRVDRDSRAYLPPAGRLSSRTYLLPVVSSRSRLTCAPPWTRPRTGTPSSRPREGPSRSVTLAANFASSNPRGRLWFPCAPLATPPRCHPPREAPSRAPPGRRARARPRLTSRARRPSPVDECAHRRLLLVQTLRLERGAQDLHHDALGEPGRVRASARAHARAGGRGSNRRRRGCSSPVLAA